MIPTSTFRHAKELARYPLGPNGKNSFVYWSDVKRQWEESHDSRKILGLIGSQSAAGYKRADLRKVIGSMTRAETALAERFRVFYEKMVPLCTSMPVSPDIEIDWLETVIDLRRLSPLMGRTSRVLDIGPGAARHMVALASSPELRGLSYTGIECIGLPYAFQNVVGCVLARDQGAVSFVEYLDHQFARESFQLPGGLGDNTFYHLPFWETHRLPEKSYDVILCTYVLDEVAPDDFVRLLGIIDRLLAPGGIVYCRGAQERALLANLYLYGYGTHHGQDITRALRGIGLVPTACDLIADTVTRIFERPRPGLAAPIAKGKYASFEQDAPLVEALQQDFLADLVAEIGKKKAKVVVWGDPGYQFYSQYIAPYWDRLNIIGMTQRFAVQRNATGYGYMEYPVADIPSLSPDVVIFASMRFSSYLRELKELTGSSKSFTRVRRFAYPIAAAFRD